jgi:hypothetical protein
MRIFGPKREEVAGDWRRLHNEELHNLYPSPNIINEVYFSLCLTKHHAMKTYWGNRGILLHILNLSIRWR